MSDLDKVDGAVKDGADQASGWIKRNPWLATIAAAATIIVVAVLAFRLRKFFN